MRVLALSLAILGALAIPTLAQAGCTPAHTAAVSTPTTSAGAPQSTPVKPAGG